jgi:hypothetical protein
MSGSALRLLAVAALALLTTCGGLAPQTTADERVMQAVLGVLNQDSLKDGRLDFARPGWKEGNLPPDVTGWDEACPAPLGAWPAEHAYRSHAAAPAELKVLGYPWLSPEELRAARAITWKERSAAKPLPAGASRAEGRDDWELATAKGTWRVAHLQRAWPGGGGAWVIAACAPTAAWAEAEAALAAAAAGLVPVERPGLEAAVERARELADAARSWRLVLPPAAVEARVAGAREAALGALRGAPGFEARPAALMAAAEGGAFDRRGVEAGPGWDAAGTAALVEKARALDPSGKATLGADRLEGRARLALGEPARALALLEPLVTGVPSPSAYLLADVGEARAALGRADEAAAAFRLARARLDEDRRSSLPGTGPLAADVRRRQDELEARLAARAGR